jgi:histo-blood group ABO system transferase
MRQKIPKRFILLSIFISVIIIIFITAVCVACTTTSSTFSEEFVQITTVSEMTNNELLKSIFALKPSIDPIVSNANILNEIVSRQVFEPYIPSNIPENETIPTVSENQPSIISKLIDEIVFINMQGHEERKMQIINEIQKISEPGMIVTRFQGIKKENGALGCALSHLHVLLYAALNRRNVLIFEDDFEFNDSKEQIIQKLQMVNDTFPQNRWDVIVFGQFVKEWSSINKQVMRLLESTTTSGYLVHKDYAETLYKAFLSHITPRLNKAVFEPNDHIDQFQLSLQREHAWIGFQTAIGKQRPIKSIIGDVFSNNSWSISEDLKHWYGSDQILHPLKTQADFQILKIAICLVATGRYIQFVDKINDDLHRLFCRPHAIRVLLFTDGEIDFPNVSRYYTPRTGFPGDTLHRYDYILKAQDELSQFDFIFYVDVDYRILEYVNLDTIVKDVSKPGIVVTTHLFGLQSEYHHKNHVGSPDTNPKSTACIYPNEKMVSYFAGGFQGGTRERFLDMCRSISKNIAIDEKNGVMALWHDESHLNRYCVTHIPETILSPSFIYPEYCLQTENNDRTCCDLRIHSIRPVMIPLDKNHDQVRAV